jgi:signal transduction histidine kinase
MKKRLYYALAAVFLFFGLGLALDFGFTKEDHLNNYARDIERSLHKKELEVDAILADTGFLFRNLRGIELLTIHEQEDDLLRLEKLADKLFNLSIYHRDSLVFWLNNQAFLPPADLSKLSGENDGARFVHLPNGYFELIKRDLPNGNMAVALLPIKREYPGQSSYLISSFETEGYSIPPDVVISEKPTGFPVKNLQGKTLTWLDATGPANDRLHLQIVFFIYILGFIALGVLINDLALMLVQRYKPWVGAAFMLGTVISARWLTVKMGLTAHFSSFQTFSTVWEKPMFEGVESLGELLINIVLLVWMMVFFNREFQVKEFVHPSKVIRFALSTLHFFAINLGLVMVCNIFKNIILDSRIVFDFENVFNLNMQSILAMIGVVLLLLSLFLFSHRMMLAIHKVTLPKSLRLLAMLLSLGAVLPVVIETKMQLDWYFFLPAATLYLLVLEVFVEVRAMSLGWLVAWLMLFSGLTAGLLYKYNNDKDYNRRKDYARELASFKDSLGVIHFQRLETLLLDTVTFRSWDNLVTAADGQQIPIETVRDLMAVRLTSDKYLLHNYEFSLSGFYLRTGENAFTGQEETFGMMEEQFHKAVGIKDFNLRFRPPKTRDPGYLMRLEIPATRPLIVFVKFKRTFSFPSKVSELLMDGTYKKLEELNDYDYGIYQDRKLIEERNKSYGKVLTDAIPPPGRDSIIRQTSTRSELMYHADKDDIVIIIGRDSGGYYKPLSLFSYVFTLLAIAVIIFSGINYFTNALPGPLNFFRSMKPSLRNQFQFWVISMIMFTFLGIGYITVKYFQVSSEEHDRDRLDRRVTSALANVNYEVKDWHRERKKERALKDKIARRLERNTGNIELADFGLGNEDTSAATLNAATLSPLIPLISEVHRLDVNIYDLHGTLITSSEEDIFSRGLVAPKMGVHAFQALSKLGYERSDQNETIGDLHYLAAYVPVNNLKGETIAFMGIPYYARQWDLRTEVTAFMSTLLNVYVFLLLIAGGLAIVVANSITRALSELSASIQRLRLGYNEPIVWTRKDEIGSLVAAYNQAVKKIEESSRLLAQSEREGAWREMAKQVAHEIKNPLTPMKLSIQYLQHAYKANAEDIEPLLKRVSKTLIEQIESLSQIANEFSNFAKMPKAENSQFSLNDLSMSVYNLFAAERPDMDISFWVPDKEFVIYADRSHLTRVLNNLFKNAIQAIPDDRQGVIELSLSHEKEKVLLRVCDNGSGIPAEIQEKVFTPNFSTKTSGTGLGLAICKSIIESFGGDIWFETEPDKGTTFFVELPLVEAREIEN